MFLTSVADHAHGRRREDEDAPAQESQLPQHHDLFPEEADELGHAACRVRDLLHKVSQNIKAKKHLDPQSTVKIADTAAEVEMFVVPSSRGACCG